MAGPSATVTATNVLAGPGALYTGAFGATEPADAAVNSVPAASAWTDAGSTHDGLMVTVNQEFFELEVDQVPDIVGRRLTKRDVQVQTNLAEGTLANIALTLNDSTSATGSGFATLTPSFGQSAMFPTAKAVIVDGWAPTTSTAKTRRFIARKVVSIEAVETAYKKDDQYVLPVTFGAMYVDASTAPCKWVDAT